MKQSITYCIDTLVRSKFRNNAWIVQFALVDIEADFQTGRVVKFFPHANGLWLVPIGAETVVATNRVVAELLRPVALVECALVNVVTLLVVCPVGRGLTCYRWVYILIWVLH